MATTCLSTEGRGYDIVEDFVDGQDKIYIQSIGDLHVRNGWSDAMFSATMTCLLSKVLPATSSLVQAESHWSDRAGFNLKKKSPTLCEVRALFFHLEFHQKYSVVPDPLLLSSRTPALLRWGFSV